MFPCAKVKKGGFNRVLALIMSVMALAVAAPANAATIQWNLNDVTVPNSSGIALTGYFVYDSTAASISEKFPIYSISLASPSNSFFGNFTLTQSNSFVQYGGSGALSIMNDGATSSLYQSISLGSYGAFDGTSGALLLLSPYLSGIATNYSGINRAAVLQGKLTASVSPVPLPATFPLFGSGILALACLSRGNIRSKTRGNNRSTVINGNEA